MASDLNVVLLTGRLAAEPELRFTSRGTPAASLRVASTRYWKAQDSADGEFKKQSLFITVETLGKTAERIAGARHKGDGLIIRGRLVYEEWVDAQGEKKRNIKIYSDDVSFVPSTKATADSAADHHAEDVEGPEPHDGEMTESVAADAALQGAKPAREGSRARH